MFKLKNFILIFIIFATISCIGKKLSTTSLNTENMSFRSAPVIPYGVALCRNNETFSLLRIYNNLPITLYISAERYNNG